MDFLFQKNRRITKPSRCNSDVRILEKIVHASKSEKNLISFQKSYYVCYNEILESNRVHFNLKFLNKLQKA